MIETDRRALPEHATVAGIPRVKCSIAIAQAAYESPACFLSKNIAVGLAPAAERFFNTLANPLDTSPKNLLPAPTTSSGV